MRLWLKMKILARYGSQTRFARELGKSDDWISKIIVGRRDPGEEDKDLIASKLGANGGDERELLFAKQGQV